MYERNVTFSTGQHRVEPGVGLLFIYVVVYAVLVLAKAFELTDLAWWWVHCQALVPAGIVVLVGMYDVFVWLWRTVRNGVQDLWVDLMAQWER